MPRVPRFISRCPWLRWRLSLPWCRECSAHGEKEPDGGALKAAGRFDFRFLTRILYRYQDGVCVIKTLVVDDEPIARKVLREELELFPDVVVVGEAEIGKASCRERV